MQDYEKLGVFYLGGRYDLAAGERMDEPLLYEAKDLTTHAVCVGMTGSGKTGLCISLLEEAAIDRIPALIIDPKGDLGNLMLTFPDLSPSDFQPWIDEAEAAAQGYTVAEYAARTAATWRAGLAKWGQDPGRIKTLRENVDISIYTPGSTAGRTLTVLKSFAAPDPSSDADAVRDRIQTAVSGLLAMLGVDVDPLQSREHILLSNILHHAWKEGHDLDLPGMIQGIQSPPFDKLGVFKLESFYPEKERFALALRLNNMLAAPGFDAWMRGEPLDIQRLLWTPDGKPRLSILSIAHLSPSERMFFVTTLLNEVVGWMRTQPGTSSLRAILYMDEIFGYFPPTANPPSKLPMLTLLKQARAYGLGCVLSTQNPVDLDYKGLSNTGTWFIGRLQTERDKMRVLDGLEGASGSTGQAFDRARVGELLSRLGSRVFLMNNVHDDEPFLFQTRWALSYLRGPLTRTQIQALTEPPQAPAEEAPAPPAPPAMAAAPVPPAGKKKARTTPPALPASVPQRYLPAGTAAVEGTRRIYRPALLASVRLHFVSARSKVDTWQELALMASIPEADEPVNWDEATVFESPPKAVRTPGGAGEFAPVPAAAADTGRFASWPAALKKDLYQARTLTLWTCRALKTVSRPGETEGDFRVRLAQLAHEQRDLALARLKKKYASKFASAQERIRKGEARIEREAAQYKTQTFRTAISFGTTLLGAMLGRRAASVGTVTRAGTAVRGAGRAAKEKQDIAHAREDLAAQQEKRAVLEAAFEEEADALKEKHDPDTLQVEETVIRPRKSDILVDELCVLWTPWTVDPVGIAEPAF